MKLTLSNNFHNTSCTVYAHGPNQFGLIFLSKAQVKRTRNLLCGTEGCTCGDEVGARPFAGFLYNHTGKEYVADMFNLNPESAKR